MVSVLGSWVHGFMVSVKACGTAGVLHVCVEKRSLGQGAFCQCVFVCCNEHLGRTYTDSSKINVTNTERHSVMRGWT